MQYLDCPGCRARFHTGVIYEPPDRCPRCGQALHPTRSKVRKQLRGVLTRGPFGQALDWESITSSQYVPRRGVRVRPAR